MKQRCENPNCEVFKYYGGRGIRVCDRWQVFENFVADMGARARGMTLDRIDVNEGYSPDNCRWADRQTQSRNTRVARSVLYQGELVGLSDLADQLGLHKNTLRRRITNGWPEARWAERPTKSRRIMPHPGAWASGKRDKSALPARKGGKFVTPPAP